MQAKPLKNVAFQRNSEEYADSKETDGVENKENGEAGKVLEAWERVRKTLRVQLGEDVYMSWFNGLSYVSVDERTFNLSISTTFLKHWVEEKYGQLLYDLVCKEIPDIEEVVISVRGAVRRSKLKDQKKPKSAKALPAPGDAGLSYIEGGKVDAGEQDGLFGRGGLDPKYTFVNFCVGDGNHLAFAAAREIGLGERGTQFNPLFIHAKVGLGKTHLLQAIAWESMRRNPRRRVLYMPADKFMQLLREGFKDKSVAERKEQLRDVDVILIDDVQFLNGGWFQQEFCHLLTALIESKKQIVVTADRPPTELDSLDERVLSRLRGGVSFQLGAPDIDMRRRILDTRLAAISVGDQPASLPPVVLDYVANMVATNGRDLEGALNRLIAQQCYTKSEVTLESAKLVLNDLIRTDEPRKVRIEDIQKAVASHFGISRADLTSQRRTRTIVRPRQIAMYLCKAMTPRSLPEIGKKFGGRDHTTVIHAVNKVEELMSEDASFSDDVELLRRLLND